MIEMGTWASLVPGLYGPALGGYSCLCTTFSLVFLTHLNLYFNVQDNLQLRLILSFSQGKIWHAVHLTFYSGSGMVNPFAARGGGFHPGSFLRKERLCTVMTRWLQEKVVSAPLSSC